MKLGFYSEILHDRPLTEALATVKKIRTFRLRN